MNTVLRILITVVLFALLASLCTNALTYFNFGGLRGALSSNVLVLAGYLIGAAALVAGIVFTWRKQ